MRTRPKIAHLLRTKHPYRTQKRPARTFSKAEACQDSAPPAKRLLGAYQSIRANLDTSVVREFVSVRSVATGLTACHGWSELTHEAGTARFHTSSALPWDPIRQFSAAGFSLSPSSMASGGDLCVATKSSSLPEIESYSSLKLMKPFLLRFEEQIVQDHLVKYRNPSVPARNRSDSSEAVAMIVAGTRTLTEIRKEQPENDPAVRSLSAFPQCT